MAVEDKLGRELVERYLYEVTRRVSKEQREDIRLELEELIGDMCEQEGLSVEEVLNKLGSPEEFSKRYMDENNYVIGPEYYENYKLVLKIVIICSLAVMAASSVFGTIVNVGTDGHYVTIIVRAITEIISSFLSNAIISVISIVGMITIIFAFFERQKVKIDLKNEKTEETEWKASQLAPVPDKKAQISRGDSLANVIFSLIFVGILFFAPELLGVYVFDNHEYIRSITIFNMEVWNAILPFFVLSVLASLVDGIVRLIKGCYCKVVMISNIITGAIQMVLAVIICKVFPLFNPSFNTEIETYFGMEFNTAGDILSKWNTQRLSSVILAIILLCILIEMGVTIYKTLRYKSSQ